MIGSSRAEAGLPFPMPLFVLYHVCFCFLHYTFKNLLSRMGPKRRKSKAEFMEHLLLENGKGRKARQKTEDCVLDTKGGEMSSKSRNNAVRISYIYSMNMY